MNYIPLLFIFHSQTDGKGNYLTDGCLFKTLISDVGFCFVDLIILLYIVTLGGHTENCSPTDLNKSKIGRAHV